MLASRRGAIVNISSQVARVGRAGLSPAYNASKAGVIGLTIAFSAQVADRGVRVNAVLPALVASRDFGWSPDEWAARAREYPLGIGRPRDVGEAVLYLASLSARWVSGTALHFTGGYQRPAPWL
jgi:NAD(P)-dependent dehydrogenase (short-subunit alcohol dehydrogenase family)